MKKIDHKKALRQMEGQLKDGEADAVLARLAAGEVNSAAALRIGKDEERHEDAVKDRLKSTYGLSASRADRVYEKLIQKLQNSELIINFTPKKLAKDTIPTAYQNTYERNPSHTHQGGREATEMSLFKYDVEEIEIENVDIADVIKRIARGDYLSGNNPTFKPAIRPRYGSLNIFDLKGGGMGLRYYGQSFFVLKEHVKARCTVTFGDSMFPSAEQELYLGNITDLAGILRDMPDYTFKDLYAIVRGLPYDRMGLPSHRFLEAQIHTEIVFNRDVDKICLCRQELDRGTPQEIKELAVSTGYFLRKNRNMKVEYFDDPDFVDL